MRILRTVVKKILRGFGYDVVKLPRVFPDDRKVEVIDIPSKPMGGGVEQQVAILSNELAELRNMLASRLDVVCLYNAVFFVPVDDNLYHFFPEDCKHIDLRQYRPISKTATFEQLQSDVSKAIFLYLDFLFRSGMRVYFIDIGAWIGDMAIEYAVFAKQRGASFKADCYDPSRSGKLIPYNIALNKLDSSVRFFPVAAGLNDGYNIFNERWGHSDSSHLGFIKDDQMSVTSHIVETKTLSQMLPTLDPKTHIIVKIDVEGIDAAIVMQTLDKLRDVSLIVEFAPWQQQYDDFGGAAYFIEMLRRTHTVFDVHPVTRPVLVRKVQDSFIFEQDIRNIDYGYTDILAIPHKLTGHDEIVQLLSNFSFQK